LLQKILSDIAGRLEVAAIPYIVMGGQAVLLYGEPRSTKGIDITLGIDVDKAPKLMSLLNNTVICISPLGERTKMI
jgi:hypothetical protein